jgi:hypothetical protein
MSIKNLSETEKKIKNSNWESPEFKSKLNSKKVDYPSRPTALVIFACFISLFLPGAGHLMLGYFRPGVKWLGALIISCGLALFLALVLKISNTLGGLPIFFVWLGALQDLWTKGTRASDKKEAHTRA